ncbi:Helicase PriA essential for oriC/DnaA-independent DNA replication, partial [hydrothermal vent metagenome]
MLKPVIVQVAVPVPLYSLFDYLLPEAVEPASLIGCRVRVQFGRKSLVGLVVSTSHESSFALNRLKPVLEMIDTQAVLPSDLMTLLKWAAAYYHHPLGDVIFSALPKRLREGEPAVLKSENHWRLNAVGRGADADDLTRAPKQAALLRYLQSAEASEFTASQLNADWDNWRAPLQGLIKKSLVEVEEKVQSGTINESAAQPIKTQPSADSNFTLNAQQASAAADVIAALHSYQTFLLQGITGSGKTEVYLDIIEHALAQNLQVLVLVPEISLTPQLTRRFTQRLNTQIASLHSGLNDTQRHSAWVQASQGIARVVIGTRSALFTPLPDLGL